jgi:hypothetical protein
VAKIIKKLSMTSKKIIPFIIVGILIRLLLSITTFHPDLSIFIIAGKTIILGNHWLSFYDVQLPYQLVFNYPPLAYLIPSIIYLPFTGILQATADKLINTHPETLFYLPLLIYKLPMILADISIVFLIPKLFNHPKHQFLSQIIWLFNPIAIYVSSMMGQVDTIIATLLIVALIFIKRKHLVLASIIIALSALIKPIGLILIPIIFLKDYQDSKSKLFTLPTLLAGPVTYLIGIAPFLSSSNFRAYALMADQTSKSTFAGISIASGHSIPFFLIFYCLTIYLFWIRRLNLKNALSAALLSSLVFSHFHPQWFVWVTPIIIISCFTQKRLSLWFVTILAWMIIVFSFDSSLHVGLFLSSSLTFTPADVFRQYSLLVALGRSVLIVLLASRYLK